MTHKGFWIAPLAALWAAAGVAACDDASDKANAAASGAAEVGGQADFLAAASDAALGVDDGAAPLDAGGGAGAADAEPADASTADVEDADDDRGSEVAGGDVAGPTDGAVVDGSPALVDAADVVADADAAATAEVVDEDAGAGGWADSSADAGADGAVDATVADGGDLAAEADAVAGSDDGPAADAIVSIDSDSDSDSDGGAAPEKVIRFAALGDSGTGSEEQYKVGKALGEKCKQSGCDLVLYLGDNFYDVGVKDETDSQFVTKFEQPYATVDAPFWVVLGNHDYGAGGAGAEFLKKDHYIKYGKKNPKFHLPEAWWHEQAAHVEFFALDSNSLLYGDVLGFIIQQQVADVDKAIAASKADWKIAFAHHPMRSNGPHGNAGCYEGAKAAPIPQLCGLIPVASGNGVKAAYGKLICGRVDVLLTGHDHSRQWLDKAASTKHCKDVELIISGGGAKTTNVETKSIGGYEFNPAHWQDADESGFLWVEIKGDTFYGEFINADGKVQYTRTFQRTP